MKSCRPPLFWKRKFEPHVIVTCVRWYCRFALSLRDLEELMAERGLSVDHTTIWRWAQAYGPEVYRRLRGEVKRKSSTWHMDQTFVRIAGKWMYLFRAVDGQGQTVDFYLSETRDREAAKLFLKKALANPDNRPPHVFAQDGLRSYPAALRELQAEGHVARHCRQRTRRYCNNRIESDHRHVKRRLRAMQGPRTTATAWAVIQGIEAAYMIRKGQGLGIYPAQPARAGVALRKLTRHRLAAAFISKARRMAFQPQMQHFPETNWGRGIDERGHVIPDYSKDVGNAQETLVSPYALGATNSWSPAYDPKTGLIFVNGSRSWNFISRSGRGNVRYPREYVTMAIDYKTGQVVWTHELGDKGTGNLISGLLTTAGGVLFGGDSMDNFLAMDPATGKTR